MRILVLGPVAHQEHKGVGMQCTHALSGETQVIQGMDDLHDYARRVERYVQKIGTLDIPECNKQLLVRFADDCYSERLSSGRIYKLLYHLVKVAHLLDKDFKAATIEDLKRVMREIENDARPYTENTKKDFRVAAKKFYKWLNDGVTPPTVSWMKATLKHCERRLPEEFPSQEDVRAMVNAADSPRDKAFVFVLYESGCRIGELMTVKLKHVSFDKYGVQMMVSGKTGARRVRIIMACDYLSSWIEGHPKRGDPESFLWVNMSTNCRGERLSYATARHLLRSFAEKAGVRKRVNPHSFRHARATHLANRLTESQLKEFLGWTQSSTQAATYVHISGRNIDDALLKMYGLKEKVDEETVFCPRCKSANDVVSRYCNKCGLPFGLDVALKAEKERGKYDDLMSKLMEDEGVRDAISKAVQRYGYGSK